MSAYAFLRDNPKPTREQIRTSVASNLCRCTGYQSIIEGVQLAAEKLRGGAS
jgi:carbon-monoxide dehydrogenase small subunit